MSDQRAERVAIMGGLGFIGSHLARALVARKLDVTLFDRLYSGRELVRDIESRIRIVESDMALPEAVIDALRDCSTVVHLVHTTIPSSSMLDPAYDIISNVAATARWLTRLDETGIRRIVYVSTGGAVYGRARTIPIDESHPTDPLCSYGATKLMIEKYLAIIAAPTGIEVRILRPGNLYGPGQRVSHNQGLVGVFLDRLKSGLPIEIWGDGEVRRDYTHIADMTSALVALLDYKGPESIFNVGTGVGTSTNEIVALLGRALGHDLAPKRTAARAYDVPINVLDASRLKQETGWRAMVSVEEGLTSLAREIMRA